jgi:chromosomal replication initiator protein
MAPSGAGEKRAMANGGEITGEVALANDDGLRGENQLAVQWASVRGRLQNEVGDAEYRAWLRQMTLVGLEGDEITISLPSRFLRDWVRSHYGDRLTALWKVVNRKVRRVEIKVGGPTTAITGLAESVTPLPPSTTVGRNAAYVAPPAHAARADSEPSGLDPRFTFDSFVVGKPNEFAYACARRVAAEPASIGFNPLFLYGGVGLGKTHLMHAIAFELTDVNRPGGPLSVVYMTAERFMYRFIASLRSQTTMEFKEQLRRADVLMIDDLHFLVHKDATQEEFFHTFNYLVEAGRQIVVSADKPPADLSGLEERVRTRLGSGMVADLHTTTFELRVSILESKAARIGIELPQKVKELLALRITSNVRELEGALNRLVAHANLFGRTITHESAQELLHDVLKAHDRRISIDEIQRRVAEHYKIRLSDMASPRRARAVARPRQVAMYLAKQLTSRSLPEIGKKFGDRDHTTVMHAVKRVAELMARDSAFADDVELLRRLLES